MSDYWAVGNRAYPEKIYARSDGSLYVYDDRKKAEEIAKEFKEEHPDYPVVVFNVHMETIPPETFDVFVSRKCESFYAPKPIEEHMSWYRREYKEWLDLQSRV